MLARDRDQEDRASTPLELLFDLCFVVAVAQAAGRLHHGLVEGDGHVGSTILSYTLVFFAIWWGWMNFTWFASAYDTDDVPYRLLTCCRSPGCWCSPRGCRRLSTVGITPPSPPATC